MTCTRYEREGRLLVEQGLPDLHRDGCVACQRAHLAYEVMVGVAPRLGASTPDDRAWRADVWRAIARAERASSGRRVVHWSRIGMGAAAVAALLLVWWVRREPPPGDRMASDRPRIEIVTGSTAMRSTSARVGDRLRVSVADHQAVWIYRGERLIVRCPTPSAVACRRDAHGALAELDLVEAGDYQIVIVAAAAPAPEGALDRDLARVVGADGRYRLTELAVR